MKSGVRRNFPRELERRTHLASEFEEFLDARLADSGGAARDQNHLASQIHFALAASRVERDSRRERCAAEPCGHQQLRAGREITHPRNNMQGKNCDKTD
jgi:hypothetical protein